MTTTTDPRRPDPAARRLVLSALRHYPCGLSASELRRRTSRAGLIHVVDAEGRNVCESLHSVVEYCLDNDLIQQRLVGRSIRFIHPNAYPAITSTTESETPA